MSDIIPASFIPDEDQGAIIGDITLPEGASMARTHEFMNIVMPRLVSLDGVEYNVAVEGYSFLGGTGENVGLFLLPLRNWDERKYPELSQESIMEKAEELTSDFPRQK